MDDSALTTRSAHDSGADSLASVLEDLHGWPQDAAAEAVALVALEMQVPIRWSRVAASLTYPHREAMIAARQQVRRLLLLGLTNAQRESLKLPRKAQNVPDTAEQARTRALKKTAIQRLNDTWATLLRLRFPQEDASPPDFTSLYPPLMYADGSATGALLGVAARAVGSRCSVWHSCLSGLSVTEPPTARLVDGHLVFRRKWEGREGRTF